MPSRISIDASRLWTSLMEMARIGGTSRGGVRRVAFSEADREGRDLFARWCRDAGCTMRIDRFGNMFARRRGLNESRPAVLVGSHLDSQMTGGRFDGALGVLAGLELVRRLNDLGFETDCPIEIVNWTNEEGCVYKPMIGSEVYTGAMSLEDALEMKDIEGRSLGSGLRDIGYAGDAPVPGDPVACYFELHIEQGPILEQKGMHVGVVTGAQGQYWYDLSLTGVEAHAGPTPMEVRRDALVGAARVILEFNRIGREFGGKATNGYICAEPNSPNVIAGVVRFSGDLRHEDTACLGRMDAEMRRAVQCVADELALVATINRRVSVAPIPFHPGLVAAVRSVAEDLQIPHCDIVSGAGHDALNMAKRYPTTMIFVPCEDGISHNEAENISPEHAAAGCAVLANVVLAAATDAIRL